jgi:hypothetical protein
MKGCILLRLFTSKVLNCKKEVLIIETCQLKITKSNSSTTYKKIDEERYEKNLRFIKSY